MVDSEARRVRKMWRKGKEFPRPERAEAEGS
jgi:hypothetical protein